jgi:hypothetical protein
MDRVKLGNCSNEIWNSFRQKKTKNLKTFLRLRFVFFVFVSSLSLPCIHGHGNLIKTQIE